MKTKVCPRCRKEKDISEFCKDNRKKDKLKIYCRKCNRKYVEEWEKKNYYRYWVNHTLNNHKKKGCKINISKNELEKIAKNSYFCNICGVKLIWEKGTWKKGLKRDNYPTLDRVNNEKEINKDNIQIICYKCNSTKWNRSMKEFIKYCEMVAMKFKGGD